jgi:hypothetical protein
MRGTVLTLLCGILSIPVYAEEGADELLPVSEAQSVVQPG